MRCGFRLKIREGSEEEYIKRHQSVYPELLKAFENNGVETYSIFMDGTTLFAYMEVDNVDDLMQTLDSNSANQEWQAFMSDILVPEDGVTMVPIPEVFYFHP